MICFYHKADFDGICSGRIIKSRFPECKMIGIDYGEEFPWDIVKDEVVYMADFSLQPFTNMIRLKEITKSLIWIDHHYSAIEEEKSSKIFFEGIREVELATCELSWIYCFPDKPAPRGVRLLGRYDVWDLNEDVLAFQYGLRSYDMSFESNNWDSILKEEEDYSRISISKVISEGYIILGYIEEENRNYIKSFAYQSKFEGLKAIVVNRSHLSSLFFKSVYKDYDILIGWCYIGGGKYTVGLYSANPNVNCGNIAKFYGGGGHKGAAGFTTSDIPFY